MDVPKVGDKFQIHSYKHDGAIHRVWRQSVILKATPYIIISGNERTHVVESDGRTWWTREPAICYFHFKNWFNIIGMLREDGIYYYCNLSSPYIFNENALKYIDYDLDIKVFPDMSYAILDEDEYLAHGKAMGYSPEIDAVIKYYTEKLISWINLRKGPFATGFVKKWYNRFVDNNINSNYKHYNK